MLGGGLSFDILKGLSDLLFSLTIISLYVRWWSVCQHIKGFINVYNIVFKVSKALGAE